MSTNIRNDTPTPAAGQRPTNLAEAIGLLSTEPQFASIESPLLFEFVSSLVMLYPNLVMAEVIRLRSGTISNQLRGYRGEV